MKLAEESKQEINKLRAQVAGFAAAIDLTGQMAGLETEKDVHRALFTFFDMMMAPQSQAFLPIHDGKLGKLVTPPCSAPITTPPSPDLFTRFTNYRIRPEHNGFELRLGDHQRPLGIVQVNQILEPEFLNRYTNFAISIVPMLNLAIENARNIERLSHIQEIHRMTRVTVDQASDQFYWIEMDGRIVDANNMACQVSGYSRAELLNINALSLIAQSSLPAWQEVWEDLRTDEEITLYLSLQTKDGRLIPVEAAVSHHRFNEREIVCAIVRDISDRIRAQERSFELALEQERSDILNEFIQNASHEFNTPLSIVKTNAYLISRTSDPVKQQERLVQINEQVDGLIQLVEMMTKVTESERAADYALEPTDLNALAKRLSDKLTHQIAEKNLTLQLNLADHKITVHADPDRLTAALLELLNNAIRYTPAQGTITLSTNAQADTAITTISDTGPGIPKEIHTRIFERFFRLDVARTSPGFGLGLALASTIVQGHGGHIQVDSNPEEGSTFRVVLPIL